MTLMLDLPTNRAGARQARPAARRHCGAVALPDGSVRWRVWAPNVPDAKLLLLDGDHREVVPMDREGDGYFVHTRPGVPPGQLYKICLDGFECRADPCSLWQPQGVAGPSAVYAPERFPFTDDGWKGVRREDLALYELHVGTFTPAGTFEAAIDRLDDLRDLGITAIEVMPVGQFPGGRNWGYDGVLPYAAQDTYGGPRGLQTLVDAAHSKGLAVILDVVYNHLGPEASYVREFGPYFTDAYKTPWGAAVNYDGPGSDAVRRFVLDNVRMWLEEFRLDGLRLDAVHAIYDLGATHILREVQQVVDEVQVRTGRTKLIVAESDLNDPRVLHEPERGGHGFATQWADDFHHAVHAFLTGERSGYYTEFGSTADLAAALRAPYLRAGQYSRHRGRRHGASPEGLSGDRFVVCVQNHDQVGNRAVGDRLTTILAAQGQAGAAKVRLAAGLMLLSPYLPMLFMGEEYAESRPFPFFCSFAGPELVEAVRQGRRREFADFIDATHTIPDPAAADTFRSAKLTWAWPEGTDHAGVRHLYQDLLAARRRWPAMKNYDRRAVRGLPEGAAEPEVVELVRGETSAPAGDGLSTDSLAVYFNLTGRPQPLPAEALRGRVVLFASEAARYGGARADGDDAATLLPFECIAAGPEHWGKAGA
ncbi:MAG: treZ [Phycisphaerales bacterium]|nr:treZ [Phycisphaerales bacterium]